MSHSSFTLVIVSTFNFHLATPHEYISLEVLKTCFNRWLYHHVWLKWEAEVMQTGEVELYPGEHEISFSLLVKLIQWHRGHSKGHSKGPGIVLPARSGSSLNDTLFCLILILKPHMNCPFKFLQCWYRDWVWINHICLNYAVGFAQAHPHNWLEVAGSSRQRTL